MKCAIMILFLSAAVSTAADDEASKKLLKELEGTYELTSAEYRGKAVPAATIATFEKASIKGDKLMLTYKGGSGKSETMSGTVIVDAAKKPAHIDFRVKGEELNKNPRAFGIIAVEGETVKICFSEVAETPRPTQFKSNKEDYNWLVTLKKMKE